LQDDRPTQPDSADVSETEGEPPPFRTPAALRYRMLAQLWWLVSPPALWLLFWRPAWLRASGFVEALAAVRLEQWIAVVLLGLHVWFLWQGRRRGG
jgi:hypothetical protein